MVWGGRGHQERKEIMALCWPPVPKVPLKGVPATFHSVLPWYSRSFYRGRCRGDRYRHGGGDVEVVRWAHALRWRW